jgi:hypothetical protein
MRVDNSSLILKLVDKGDVCGRREMCMSCAVFCVLRIHRCRSVERAHVYSARIWWLDRRRPRQVEGGVVGSAMVVYIMLRSSRGRERRHIVGDDGVVDRSREELFK